jgi:arylsulfatase A-like enzyme
MDTHMPYRPPADIAAAVGVPTATTPIIADFIESPEARQRIYFEAPYPDVAIEDTRRLYGAAVRYVDFEIDRLLKGLRDLGRADDTVVVLAADHGESLGEHGLYFAHDFTLYDELISVPLIVHVPKKPGLRIASPVSLIDVFPTLCDLTSLECPKDLDGRPLPMHSMRNRTDRVLYAAGPPARKRYDENPRLSVGGLDGRWTMVRSDDRKLIRIPKEAGPTWELYDLARDPKELRNVYRFEEAAPLAGALRDWMNAIGSDRPREAEPPRPLGRSTREALKELGYLD